jgi:hypothetical protein
VMIVVYSVPVSTFLIKGFPACLQEYGKQLNFMTLRMLLAPPMVSPPCRGGGA